MHYQSVTEIYGFARERQEQLLREFLGAHYDEATVEEQVRARFFRDYKVRKFVHRFLPGIAARIWI